MELLYGAETDAATLRIFKNHYENLIKAGYEATFFGDIAELDDPLDIMLYWRVEKDLYRVIFADSRSPGLVTAEQLLHFQNRMLRNQANKK